MQRYFDFFSHDMMAWATPFYVPRAPAASLRRRRRLHFRRWAMVIAFLDTYAIYHEPLLTRRLGRGQRRWDDFCAYVISYCLITPPQRRRQSQAYRRLFGYWGLHGGDGSRWWRGVDLMQCLYANRAAWMIDLWILASFLVPATIFEPDTDVSMIEARCLFSWRGEFWVSHIGFSLK